jgi:hypothetical protein
LLQGSPIQALEGRRIADYERDCIAGPLDRYYPTGATPGSTPIREDSPFPVTGRPVREGYPWGRRIAGRDVRPVRHPRTARAHRPR